MPFEGEARSWQAIKRLASNPRIRELLKVIRLPEQDQVGSPSLVVAATRPSTYLPRFVIAIDGSWQGHEPQKGFPGAELAYLTISTVILDVAKLASLSQLKVQQPPTEYRKLENAESLDTVLPGCNVIFKDEPHARASFRRALYETLEQQKGWEGCENLLLTYEALLGHRHEANTGCPWEECEEPGNRRFRGFGTYQCSCGRRQLYSTDSLRIDEGINPTGSSGKAFGEVMQILERLKLIHILRMIWLSQAIYQELRRLNQLLRKHGLPDLLVIGIEKSGIFVEHLLRLDQDEKGVPDRLPRQSVYLPTDAYIKRNIVFSDSPQLYGKQTYFGRKFFYKTKAGSLLVAAVPFLDPRHHDTSTAEPEQFPRLADALNLLDRLETTRYPNALIPLTAAHAEATLPMSIGRQVLEKLARDLMSSRNVQG